MPVPSTIQVCLRQPQDVTIVLASPSWLTRGNFVDVAINSRNLLLVVIMWCLFLKCTMKATFNFKESTPAANCKKHSEDGMVYVLSRQCSYNSWAKAQS